MLKTFFFLCNGLMISLHAAMPFFDDLLIENYNNGRSCQYTENISAREQVLALLCNPDADLQAPTIGFCNTPLQAMSWEEQNVDLLELLLKRIPHPRIRQLLSNAVFGGNARGIQLLLSYGKVDRIKLSKLLLHACSLVSTECEFKEAQLATVRVLLQHKANPNAHKEEAPFYENALHLLLDSIDHRRREFSLDESEEKIVHDVIELLANYGAVLHDETVEFAHQHGLIQWVEVFVLAKIKKAITDVQLLTDHLQNPQ